MVGRGWQNVVEPVWRVGYCGTQFDTCKGVEHVCQKLRRSRVSCISHFGRGSISKSC
jgi:hypothetical protein